MDALKGFRTNCRLKTIIFCPITLGRNIDASSVAEKNEQPCPRLAENNSFQTLLWSYFFYLKELLPNKE